MYAAFANDLPRHPAHGVREANRCVRRVLDRGQHQGLYAFITERDVPTYHCEVAR